MKAELRSANVPSWRAVTLDELNMHRIATALFRIGALAAVSCGAPTELDDSQYPELAATGYADLGAPDNGSSAAGTSGAPSGAGGAGNVSPATGGAAPIANGAAGASGAASPNGAAGGAAAPGGSGGCPADITVLFNRPITQGGCAGMGCHTPGQTSPDLVSPNPEQRLLDMPSQCQGLSYIGSSAEDSMLALKITSPPAGCGLAMPFLMPQALSAADEACILEWIDEVSSR